MINGAILCGAAVVAFVAYIVGFWRGVKACAPRPRAPMLNLVGHKAGANRWKPPAGSLGPETRQRIEVVQ